MRRLRVAKHPKNPQMRELPCHARSRTRPFAASLALPSSPWHYSTNNASAQRAGSWVDIANGRVGSGASAEGSLLQFAKSKSSSKNGVDFGHGFAVGAGPDGIAISNSIGAGGGPLGVAHNMQVNIGANGTHVSHGGVVSQGGDRRVISGGETGTRNGQVYGGSHSTGFGNQTNAWSNSRTQQWGNHTLRYTGKYGCSGSVQHARPIQCTHAKPWSIASDRSRAACLPQCAIQLNRSLKTPATFTLRGAGRFLA